MRIVYHWKELTDDGLLKEPKDVGPSYNSQSFNWYGSGHKTKQDAIKHLIHLKDTENVRGDYVLVEVYMPQRKDEAYETTNDE